MKHVGMVLTVTYKIAVNILKVPLTKLSYI